MKHNWIESTRYIPRCSRCGCYLVAAQNVWVSDVVMSSSNDDSSLDRMATNDCDLEMIRSVLIL